VPPDPERCISIAFIGKARIERPSIDTERGYRSLQDRLPEMPVQHMGVRLDAHTRRGAPVIHVWPMVAKNTDNGSACCREHFLSNSPSS
jgi:hypothetical protein